MRSQEQARCKIFTNNKSQAVRLKGAVAFDASVREVDVVVVGNSRLMMPAGDHWGDWFDADPGITADFMVEREQPEEQERESL